MPQLPLLKILGKILKNCFEKYQAKLIDDGISMSSPLLKETGLLIHIKGPYSFGQEVQQNFLFLYILNS